MSGGEVGDGGRGICRDCSASGPLDAAGWCPACAEKWNARLPPMRLRIRDALYEGRASGFRASLDSTVAKIVEELKDFPPAPRPRFHVEVDEEKSDPASGTIAMRITMEIDPGFARDLLEQGWEYGPDGKLAPPRDR